MDLVVSWAVFTGSWLLVLGALHQATLEFAGERSTMDKVDIDPSRMPRPESISLWWWLLPPVRIVLGRRRRRVWRDQVSRRLSHEQIETMYHFVDVARGWLTVGAGAWLLAFGATWSVVGRLHLGVGAFLTLVAASTALVGLVAASTVRRRRGDGPR